MAGDEANRPNFLKSTVFGAVMNPDAPFIGESVVQAYLGGPGINQRSLFNWAVRNNYPGLPTYSISQAIVVDPEVVRPFISIPGSPAGLTLMIQEASLADGDYEVWAKQYMNLHYPSEINSDWVAEYDSTAHTITIQREGGVTVTFSAGTYDPNGRFVVCNYYLMIPEDIQTVITGVMTTGVTGGLPTTSGYTLTSTTNTGLVNYTQDQTQVVTRTYSDSTPTSVVTDYPHIVTSFNTIYTIHEKEVYNGGSGSSPETSKTKTFRNVWEYRQVYTSSSTSTVVNDLGGGVTETVTTVITGDFLRPLYDWRLDTQDTILEQSFEGNQTFIYKIGTGNSTLDALNVAVGSAVTAEFFPFIPIRLNNISITDPSYASIYGASKSLYKKATKNQTFKDLVTQVENNPDLSEIDYAYVEWAITLNTKDNEAKKYLYNFWKNLIPVHGLPSTYMDNFIASTSAYNTQMNTLNAWIAAQSNPVSSLYGTAKPSTPSFGAPKTTTLQLKSADVALQSFDNRISFSFIDETVFTGVGQVGAKKGDFWLTTESPVTWTTYSGVTSLYGGPGGGPSFSTPTINSMSLFNIYWQSGTNQYRCLRVYGAIHQNFVYGGKCVTITGAEALADTNDSGFLIPLHYPSLKDAGLISSTQLATCNTYIVFNSYEIFKKKWYETFLGMLFIIIVVVVVAALIAPSTIGGISGIFGANAAVGGALGLSGTAAIVAGAVANAIAAVLISTALSYGSTALFGEKWGSLIGSLLSFAISFGMAGGFSDLATLFQPSNLLALSSAMANGYKGFVQGSISEMNSELANISTDYEKKMDEIQDLLSKLMGNDLAFNPMSFTDTTKGNGSKTGSYLPESLDDFIQRTTLTGSDIVDLTFSMINNFSNLSLTLPRT
jgi:hypothetical protein